MGGNSFAIVISFCALAVSFWNVFRDRSRLRIRLRQRGVIGGGYKKEILEIECVNLGRRIVALEPEIKMLWDDAHHREEKWGWWVNRALWWHTARGGLVLDATINCHGFPEGGVLGELGRFKLVISKEEWQRCYNVYFYGVLVRDVRGREYRLFFPRRVAQQFNALWDPSAPHWSPPEITSPDAYESE